MVDLAGDMVEHARAVSDPVTPEMLPLLAQLAPHLGAAVDRTVDGREPEQALGTLRELLRASQDDDIEALVTMFDLG